MLSTTVKSVSIRHLGALFGVLIVLVGILDVISTNLVLQAGGIETNPIVVWTMERLDEWWHVPKMVIHLVAGLLVYHLLSTRFTAALAFLLVFMYGVVVHHNFSLALAA